MADSILKSFKYRVYPSKSQIEILAVHLSEACRLYNAAVQERTEAWKLERKNILLYDQMRQLTEIRASGDIDIASCKAARDPLKRVDKAFRAFFRRVKAGEKPGYPRYKSFRRYHSITFDAGTKLSQKLYVQGVGDLRIKLHRPIAGKVKTTTLKREGNKWFAIFSCEVAPEPLPVRGKVVGIDAGIASFITLSDGTHIDNWRYRQSEQKRLRRAQRAVARRKKGSHRRRKAAQLFRNIHQMIANRRSDFQHKLSRALVNNYDLIAVENLSINGLSRGILAKQIHDVSWGGFFEKVAYKAESAGRVFVKVNPNYTSQDCSDCGYREKKPLAERQHNCKQCGLSLHRDENAALNILRLGLSLHPLTYQATESVG